MWPFRLKNGVWIRPFPWDHGKELLTAAFIGNGSSIRDTPSSGTGGRSRKIRYEDLVADPRSTLAGIGQFIGQELDYDQIRRVSRPNRQFIRSGWG